MAFSHPSSYIWCKVKVNCGLTPLNLGLVICHLTEKRLCFYVWQCCESAPVSHFGLLQRSVCALPVDHAEGDALGLRRERPGDGGPRCVHGDRDGAVTAGLDEKLPTAVLEG